MPVVNKETVIKALDSSSQIRSQFMSNNNVRDCREIYPYLMDIDLVRINCIKLKLSNKIKPDLLVLLMYQTE